MKFKNSLIIKNLINRYPNNFELGRIFRQMFPRAEACIINPNDQSLGQAIRQL
jgi:hypothetical protein